MKKSLYINDFNMKVLFHNVYDEINQNNTLFENSNVLIGDNLLKPFNLIPEKALEFGIIVGTTAKIKLEEADIFVFVDFPQKNDPVFSYAILNNKKMFLIVYESPIISIEGLNPELHVPFLKVFTWADSLISKYPDRYIKLNYLHDLSVNLEFEKKRNKSFIIIAGNKKSSSKNELYSLRYRCIKWFEKYHPNDLDLYGYGWEFKIFQDNSYIGKLINYFNYKYKFLRQKLKCYKGSIARKSDVLKKYNFSVCFENVHGYDGYITEKIFDCLLAGTIPIYKGAPNIEDYIPRNCFIYYDQFSNFDNMYKELNSMSEERIETYRSNIKTFLKSEKANQFEVTYLSDVLIDNILNIP